jgi:hypothetical protein
MTALIMFYIHAFVVILSLAIGMSETFPELAWGQILVPLIPPLWLVNISSPFVIYILAKKEKRSPASIGGLLETPRRLRCSVVYPDYIMVLRDADVGDVKMFRDLFRRLYEPSKASTARGGGFGISPEGMK